MYCECHQHVSLPIPHAPAYNESQNLELDCHHHHPTSTVAGVNVVNFLSQAAMEQLEKLKTNIIF
jgi:hypothetical protein